MRAKEKVKRKKKKVGESWRVACLFTFAFFLSPFAFPTSATMDARIFIS